MLIYLENSHLTLNTQVFSIPIVLVFCNTTAMMHLPKTLGFYFLSVSEQFSEISLWKAVLHTVGV